MSQQTLKDSRGNIIGYIDTRPDGTQVGKDSRGNLKGEYNPKNDTTKDNRGNIFGKGNLLSALIVWP